MAHERKVRLDGLTAALRRRIATMVPPEIVDREVIRVLTAVIENLYERRPIGDDNHKSPRQCH
jgi:hypothetical protein